MADDDKKSERGKKAAAQQQMTPNAEGNVLVDVIMGPYRGSRLMMPEADGQAAINGHWAVELVLTHDDDDEPHDPLTDQQRQDALAAAHTWAQAQWDVAQGVATPKAEEQKRAMEPEGAGAYQTRQAESKHPEPPRQHEQPKHEPPKR